MDGCRIFLLTMFNTDVHGHPVSVESLPMICISNHLCLRFDFSYGYDDVNVAEFSIVKAVEFSLLSWSPRMFIVATPAKLSSTIVFLRST